MTSKFGGSILLLVAAFASLSMARQQRDVAPRPAVQTDPITAIIDAFRTHRIVDVRPLQPDVASWRVPSIAVLRGTALGSSCRFHRGAEDLGDFVCFLEQRRIGLDASVPEELEAIVDWNSSRERPLRDAL